jgi:hypothetical protein
LDRSAAARGGLISGSALKAAARYGQDMGSQEYTNAFNRYQTECQARLGPLQSLAGVGQTSVNALGQAGATNAANLMNAYGAAGQAQASGYMGMANAAAGGVGQYLGYQNNNNLVNALNQNRGYGGSGSGYMANSPYNFSGISEYG